MFRKSLFPILCAATYAAAIPLRIGESWVWQVTNRDSLEIGFRSAVVVDSQSIPEGRIWTLVARDSLLKESDTAKILAWRNGRQNWLRQSRFLGWELESRRTDDTTVAMLTSDASSVWGEASSLEPVVRGRRFSQTGRSLVRVDSTSVDWRNAPDSVSTPLPLHVWSDTHGMEQALTFWGTTHGRDWRLVSHNGQVVVPPQDFLKIPAINTEMTWTKKTFQQTQINIDVIVPTRVDSSERIQWKILEQGRDSAGWKSVSIQQKEILCLATICVSCGPVPVDTVCRDRSVDEGTVWIHPGRGQSFGTAPLEPILQEGWVVRWEDALQSGPDLVSRRSWTRSGSVYQSWTEMVSTRKEGQLASYSYKFSSGLRNSPGGLYVSSPGGSTLVLRGVNPPGSSVRGTPFHGETNWGAISRNLPNLPVRFSTAAGRTGTLVASEIVQRPAALRGKTLFLQARLPDGRMWHGTHVVP